MVEVLSNWDEYVSDPLHIAMRGATYLFDEEGACLYEYRSKGVLTYSATIRRPLTFLEPYIGAIALNPLGLPDGAVAASGASVKSTSPRANTSSCLPKAETRSEREAAAEDDDDEAEAEEARGAGGAASLSD